MAITNIVVTDLGGGNYRVNWDSSLVSSPGNVNAVFLNYGTTSAYGTQVSGQPVAPDGHGGVSCLASASGPPIPFHFQCEVTDFNSGDDKSSDQTYPPPTPEPPSFLSLVATPTGSTSIRLTWVPREGATFQVYRGTTNVLSDAVAIGSPVGPNVAVFNDYGRAAGTQYYYWLVQVS